MIFSIIFSFCLMAYADTVQEIKQRTKDALETVIENGFRKHRRCFLKTVLILLIYFVVFRFFRKEKLKRVYRFVFLVIEKKKNFSKNCK